MQNQVENVLRHQLFRADQHINWHRRIVEQFGAIQIMRGTNPRNFGRRMVQRMRNLAGNHIDFVAVGHCHQHIGVFDSGTFQHPWVGRLPHFHPHIEFFTQVTQGSGIRVHNGDIVVFVY